MCKETVLLQQGNTHDGDTCEVQKGNINVFPKVRILELRLKGYAGVYEWMGQGKAPSRGEMHRVGDADL